MNLVSQNTSSTHLHALHTPPLSRRGGPSRVSTLTPQEEPRRVHRSRAIFYHPSRLNCVRCECAAPTPATSPPTVDSLPPQRASEPRTCVAASHLHQHRRAWGVARRTRQRWHAVKAGGTVWLQTTAGHGAHSTLLAVGLRVCVYGVTGCTADSSRGGTGGFVHSTVLLDRRGHCENR